MKKLKQFANAYGSVVIRSLLALLIALFLFQITACASKPCPTDPQLFEENRVLKEKLRQAEDDLDEALELLDECVPLIPEEN